MPLSTRAVYARFPIPQVTLAGYEHRIQVRRVRAGLPDGLLLVTLYGVTGEGPTDANIDWLHKIGEIIMLCDSP